MKRGKQTRVDSRQTDTEGLEPPIWIESAERLVHHVAHPIPAFMEIAKRIQADCWEFMLSGRVDGIVANQLEVDILAAIRQNAKAVYVNLAEATFLCTAGIRVLLQYHRQMKNKGLTLLVTRPSSEVASTLEMTGFPELVEK